MKLFSTGFAYFGMVLKLLNPYCGDKKVEI